MNEQDIISSLTGLTPLYQNQLFRYFARLDTQEKLEALTPQRQKFHLIKKENHDVTNTALTLASMLLSIDSYLKGIDPVKRRALALRTRRPVRSEKREKIVGLWAIVRKLKLEEGYSWRSIATYLLQYHHIQVSHVYLHELWESIETNIHKEIRQ